jgi:hypothetical protein
MAMLSTRSLRTLATSAAVITFALANASPAVAVETRPSLAVSATSLNPSCTGSSGPGKAVDGLGIDIHNNKWCALPLAGHVTLIVNLRSLWRIEEVAIYHAGYAENWAYNTRDFTLWLSGDGVSWYHPVAVTNSNASVTRHDMGALPARYIKLDITKATQTASNIARIYEVWVIGYQIA